jgi:hypothetical protein
MATRDYSITGPDGRTLTINGPDNATPEQLRAAAERAFSMSAAPAEQSFPQKLGRQVLNAGAGALRGAGSIGATLLTPLDAGARALGIENSVIGRRDRREAMTSALGSMGAETDSLAFGAGKLAGEVAGTLGVGSGVANALTRVAPRVAAAAPNVVNAIRTSGMTGGNLLRRTAGGAVAGGAAAGLVDPEQATTGALIGGALPGAMKVAGMAGNKLGGVIKGPAQTLDMAASVKQARDAGYVIPPTQANPTLRNRVLEGFSGKITTAQNASAKNQTVTNRLAAEALGLPADVKITPDSLKSVRDAAGQAYQAIGGSGTVAPGPAYTKALDAIEAPFLKAAQGFPNAKPSPVLDIVESLRSPSFDAGSAVEKIKALRTAADDAFRSGNTDIARASRAGAAALEDALEAHLAGNPQVLKAFRDARQLIAKTYTVEKALNPTTGAIDARKLAAELKKGKPLTGDLKAAADFAAQFPKAAQTVEGMGSLPQTSPLDWGLAGGLSMATSNPLMLASVMARPAARAAVLSPMVQNRLIQSSGPNALQRLASNPDLVQLGYRAAPGASAGR